MLKKILLSIALFCSLGYINGQESSNTETQKPKTNYYLARANKSYRALQYASAAEYFRKCLTPGKKAIDPKDELEATLGLADCYWNMREYKLAESWYTKLSSSIRDTSKLINYRMAEILAMDKKYSEASKILSAYPEFKARANGFLQVAEMNKDSADWKVKYLDLNTTEYREFSPLVVNNKFYWSTNEPAVGVVREIASWDGNDYMHILSLSDTSLVKGAPMPTDVEPKKDSLSAKGVKRLAEHFSIADVDQLRIVKLPRTLVKKRDSVNFQAIPILAEEKIRYNIANLSFSPATQKIYFSVNRQGKLDDENAIKKITTSTKEITRVITIAEGKLQNNNITDVKYLPIGSNNYSVMHPAIHPNGKVLIFSSNQPGGMGGYDLYAMNRIDDTSWSAPVPLPSLNSAGNELFSGFSAAGDLYFSSDGNPGFGGLDIFKVVFSQEGKITAVEHLPEPLNSSHDDFGFTETLDGKRGFVSSDRYKQQDDIFAFEYEKKIVPISGYVFSRYTEARKPGVKVILKNITKDSPASPAESVLTDGNGDFNFEGRPNNDYVVTIDNGGDDIQKLEFTTKNVFDKKPLGIFYVDKKKEIVVEAPKPKPDTVRFIIYFAFDKSSLTNKAKKILSDVAELLKQKPDLKAILDGHTDLWGDNQYNFDLSNRRVKEACKYISQQGGVTQDQTDCSQYYGKQRPVFNTLDREVSGKNRRVEILVTNK